MRLKFFPVLLFVLGVACINAIALKPLADSNSKVATKQTAGKQTDLKHIKLDKPVKDFIQQMVTKHQMDKAQLQAWFGKAVKQQKIIDAMNRPAESMPWHRYRKIWMKPERLKAAIEFWNKYQTELSRAETTFQVPASMIVGILGVETYFGRIKGTIAVWDALYTLSFHYPKRASFFRGELEEFLLLAREQHWSPLEPKGSYAGAMGWGQFIASSYRAYAVDFDGDDKIDIINNPVDAIGSVANYFRKHKWRWGEPVAFKVEQAGTKPELFAAKSLKPVHNVGAIKQQGFDWPVATLNEKRAALYGFEQEQGKDYWVGFDNFYVITRYNRSPLYALAVYQFSQHVIAERAKSYWQE